MPFLHMVGHHHRVRNFVNQLIFPIYGWALAKRLESWDAGMREGSRKNSRKKEEFTRPSFWRGERIRVKVRGEGLPAYGLWRGEKGRNIESRPSHTLFPEGYLFNSSIIVRHATLSGSNLLTITSQIISTFIPKYS